MRRLAALICALSLALTVGSAGAGAEGIAPAEGKWSALTSAGLPVSFEVKAGQIVNPRFKFHWGFCGNFESAVPGSAAIEPNGRWKYVDSRGPFIEGDVVAPDRIEGTVNAPSRMLPGCPETKATFIAAPGELALPANPPVRAVTNIDNGDLAIRPSMIQVSPEETDYFESFSFRRLEWKSFGGPVALASGISYDRESCATCRDKKVHRFPVKLRLSRLVTQGGFRVYARLRWVAQGPVPHGYLRHGVIGTLGGE